MHSAIVPGASGSLIISRPTDGRPTRLVGMVSRSLDWVPAPQAPRQPLGLGVAFTSNTLRQVLDLWDEVDWRPEKR